MYVNVTMSSNMPGRDASIYAQNTTTKANLEARTKSLGARVLRVLRHKDHPMAQVVLSQEEPAKRIVNRTPAPINGIEVVKWESMNSQKAAILLFWKGGLGFDVSSCSMCFDLFALPESRVFVESFHSFQAVGKL